jgi:hypothetical protein
MLISDCAVQLRKVCEGIQNLSTNVNGQGAGQATLQAAGYNTADATTALAAISYLNTMAALYYGSAAQPTAFNFNNQLSQYWGGR